METDRVNVSTRTLCHVGSCREVIAKFHEWEGNLGQGFRGALS